MMEEHAHIPADEPAEDAAAAAQEARARWKRALILSLIALFLAGLAGAIIVLVWKRTDLLSSIKPSIKIRLPWRSSSRREIIGHRISGPIGKLRGISIPSIREVTFPSLPGLRRAA